MWFYKDKELSPEDIPEDALGFIYKITNTTNGRAYIGKKLLTKASYKTVNGKKKKVRKESDWLTYYSSCDELKADIKLLGKDKFKREILCFTYTLITHTYLENKYLYVFEVLESDNWYNGNISSKIFKNRIMGKIK